MKFRKSGLLQGSFLKELLLTTLLVFMCSSIVSLFLYNHYYTNQMRSTYEDKIKSDSELILDMIQGQIRELQIHASTIGKDTNLANYLNRYVRNPDSTLYYTEFESEAIDELNTLYLLFSDLLDSSAFIAGEKVFSNYQLYERHDSFPEEFVSTLYSSDDDSFTRILPPMENPIFAPGSYVIPIVFRYETFNGSVSFLIAFISCQKLAMMIADTYLSYFDGIIITDDAGNTVFSEGITGNRKNVSVMDTDFPTAEWNVRLIRDDSALKATMRNLYIIEALLLLSIMLLSSIIISAIYTRFTKPLKELMKKMLRNSRDGKYEHFEYESENEIGTLTHCYNEVIDEVGNLVMTLNEKIDELEEEKKQREWEAEQKRLAEIKALQAQINPHFLYNALNSIVWMTTDNGDEKATEFTLHLANYYHTSLSRGEEFIKLKEEITHSRDYLWLQSHRYDRITYSIHMEPELEDIKVPKIIIQPLIENAIYHGLKPKDEGSWKIAINAYRVQDKLVLSVYDNGMGIGERKLRTISNNLHDGIVDSTSGYGIYNVNNRIKLTHGKEYGLKIYSREGKYTLSVIELPFNSDEHIDNR